MASPRRGPSGSVIAPHAQAPESREFAQAVGLEEATGAMSDPPLASPRRGPSGSVIARLAQAPESWDFVQAVRLVEAVGALRDPPLMPADIDDDEKLRLQKAPLKARFVSEPRTRFPTATITEVGYSSEDEPLSLTVSGFGLLGAVGVLPYSYTALVTSSQHDNNNALKAFIDIFQHRAVELFYQAASKYRIVVGHDRRERGQPDRFTGALAGLTGMGSPALRNRMALPDDTVLHFAGLFASKARTIAGLEALLASVLAAPASVLPLVGRWLDVAESEQTRLGGGQVRGASGVGPGQHCALGASAMAGARAWSVQNGFRIMIGPIEAADIAPLLPDGRDARVIADLVGMYCGLEYEFDLNLVVKAASVPAARLALHGDGPEHADMGAARLGQTSWMLSSPSLIDRDDAIFSLEQPM